jgi:crotonobetainyl-CoA:carnitine CoA-transferase CaiB-like acyl-CoA transferase
MIATPPHSAHPGPLAGVRIIDLTTVVLGPYATQMLGDLGADVIKVESSDGDTTRHIGPRRHPYMAAMFLSINRNKRSIALDLKTAAGRDVLARLIDSADVFVHNIRPQKLEPLGLAPEALLTRHSPAVVLRRARARDSRRTRNIRGGDRGAGGGGHKRA